MSAPFRCPQCHTPHTTLRELLCCHPRELRAMTDELAAKQGGASVSLYGLLGGDCPPALRRQADQRLNPAPTQEAA